MRLLQAGITGFNTSDEVSVKQLQRAVHAAAQAAGAKVVAMTPANALTPNFHQFDLVFAFGKIMILCNRHMPVVAFADRIDGMEFERFLAAPTDFAAVLSECGFVIGSAVELNRQVTGDDLSLLSAAEQNEAKYWKPKRVGDIIFNWWD